MIRLISLVFVLAGFLHAEPADLRLPTENCHLFDGQFDRFYMYVDRTFEGQASKPWEAGTYGFVRNAVRINGEVLLTKFHEGIDISPMKRDKAGNPLDMVTSISAGQVAHVSAVSSHSNYGKYVVVEHLWEGTKVVSLYAHLADITVKPGDAVTATTPLGRMGFTGAGIDRTRAHCHVELGMLMSSRYEDWHKKFSGGVNHHGNYNGMNICGAEVSRFFVEKKANPELKFSHFITTTPAYFKVAVPIGNGTPDFVVRYPWISQGTMEGAKSWEISFTATGLPVAFRPSQREVTTPVIVSVRPSTVPHRYLTRNLVSGEGNRATLSDSGKKLLALLTGDFPVSSAALTIPKQ